MTGLLKKSWARMKSHLRAKQEIRFPLDVELPLPPGISEAETYAFLNALVLADSNPQDMANYCAHHFKRIIHTYGLARSLNGKCLELGANPYFTTVMLQEFTQLDLVLANYFGPQFQEREIVQEISFRDFKTGKEVSRPLRSHHFNIEKEPFPFGDGTLDVVLFCEILEHLVMDPLAALREIKRILKPYGALILTTPNVARLQNVALMIAGENVFDPYSGYGPYGRHNREYTRHDLVCLLDYAGFAVDSLFTADMHPNNADQLVPIAEYAHLLKKREADLGQYFFVMARKGHKAAGTKRPAFLFRSYPAHELEG